MLASIEDFVLADPGLGKASPQVVLLDTLLPSIPSASSWLGLESLGDSRVWDSRCFRCKEAKP